MDVYHGDNVTGAENQQERLIEFRGWVIGFVDGEGCFSIGFVRQPHRTNHRGYKTGYQVSHEFAVAQGASGIGCLERMAAGRHLSADGIAGIAEITQTMNHRKPRHELIRILRGHTPDLHDSGG